MQVRSLETRCSHSGPTPRGLGTSAASIEPTAALESSSMSTLLMVGGTVAKIYALKLKCK